MKILLCVFSIYDPIICRTTTQDPLAEKYYSTSPYLWCAGNPMKYVDRDGKEYGDTLASQDAAALDFSIPASFYNFPTSVKLKF